MKRNVPVFGLLIGLVLPLLGVVIVYFIMFHHVAFADYLGTFAHSHQDAAKIMSLSLLINIVPFIYYTNRRLDNTARGILVATVLYATVIVLLKFVF